MTHQTSWIESTERQMPFGLHWSGHSFWLEHELLKMSESTSVNFLAACLYFLACRQASPPAAFSFPATTGSFCKHTQKLKHHGTSLLAIPYTLSTPRTSHAKLATVGPSLTHMS